MTREQIIRMAREAGISMANSNLLPAPNGEVEALERFADLVAAAEREECAKICESRFGTMSMYGSIKDVNLHNSAVNGCAAAIRNKGKK